MLTDQQINRLTLISCIILMVFFSTGCATKEQPRPLPLVNEKQTVNIDPALLAECPDEKTFALPPGKYTEGQLLRSLAPLVKEYRVCRQSKQELVNILCSALQCNQESK